MLSKKRYYIKKRRRYIQMKAHKYWSLGALAAMIGTFYTGYKNMKTAPKYFACSSLPTRLILPPYVNSGTTFFQKYLIKHSIINLPSK